MSEKNILVVDDEKNIRLTLRKALESVDYNITTAINGEEALEKFNSNIFDLLLLDLKMPGIDGMEVLRQVKEKWTKTRIIIITAHGNVDNAVEAMKLGAVDFIQKPFSLTEIREIVENIFKRETLLISEEADYNTLFEISKRYITDRNYEKAREVIQKAIAKDPAKPQAYNLFGALLEINREVLEALKFYRAAINIDPTFKPARDNLDRAASFYRMGTIKLDVDKLDVDKKKKISKSENGNNDEEE